MKPVAFGYVRPASVAKACAHLEDDENARILAGGQTLIPMLAMRLARPSRLIDIVRIPELSGMRDAGTYLAIGAAARQAVAERDPLLARKAPLLAKALPWVGHAPTRNRGTIGGSIANGDPAAEIPLVAVTLDATLIVETIVGTSELAAGEFYLGPMITALPEGAVLTCVRFPVWAAGRIGTAFEEVAARRSDFALVAAAVALDADGRCTALALGIGGACTTPVRIDVADALIGSRLEEGAVRKAVEAATADLETVRDHRASPTYRLRAAGLLAGIGVASCLEPSGANSSFEPLLNPRNTSTIWPESCRLMVDALGAVTVAIHTTSSGQGHETLAATVAGEVLDIDPDRIRVVRATSLESLPGNSPVGSRMAIMLGGAVHRAATELRAKLTAIGAHRLGVAAAAVRYRNGGVEDPASDRAVEWPDIVGIAHRHIHLMPLGMEPSLAVSHTMQVPTGGTLPTPDGRVKMYPCFAFEFHVVLVSIDPETGKPAIRYVIGHDCGTVINPDIVRGMTLGGIAHGIGAALMEEFAFDGEGQLVAQSFMDYLLPSAHEVPEVEIVHHVTPSPNTVLGQKGSGESGYLGAPAAISSAVNDAVRHLGLRFEALPMRISMIGDAIAEAMAAKGIPPSPGPPHEGEGTREALHDR